MARTKEKYKPVIREEDFYSADPATSLNNPLFRLFINFISVLLLGVNFQHINSGFFTSVIMFVIPMLSDIVRHKRRDKITKAIYICEILLLTTALILCSIGIAGILCIETFNEVPHIMVAKNYALFPGTHFPATILLWIAIISFFFTAFEWFATKTRVEEVLVAGT